MTKRKALKLEYILACLKPCELSVPLVKIIYLNTKISPLSLTVRLQIDSQYVLVETSRELLFFKV
jgi:hypothetical protein